jgi:SAM-dependent methyltransferase
MDLSDVSNLYSDNIVKHGISSQAVGWRDADSHRLRFEKLAAVLDRDGDPVVVNDLGCGYGAFYDYLSERQFKIEKFRGYEISEPMLQQARERVARPGVELLRGSSIEQEADYSFACGIFNVRFGRSEQGWHDYILATLDNLNAFSRKGFAFNLLTSYVDWKEEHLHYADPLFFFDHCKRKYSRHVALLHDYPLWEWTILVRRQ